jgi:N-acetylneuraminate synthase|tara:strand:+ start:3118 stop:3933 length:816 start_codon:yes stop_codon:yes gene_type:complete
MKVNIIGEIGINHNGSLEICKKIIDAAVLAGCDWVKFQKRNPDVCVPEEQKNKPKSTPWGDMTYLEYKYKVEFGKEEYDEIDRYCKEKGIGWFASVWDKDSVDFMAQYSKITKIPSALITNKELISYAREKFDYLIISTGMSTEGEIEDCVSICNPDVIMHTNSTYPSPIKELNLEYITFLKNKYKKEVGYSGHEYGLVTTFATVPLGVTWVERHITLDRTMWGSDHLASVEPSGLFKLVKGIRDITLALGGNEERLLLDSELSKRKSLRG